MSYRGHCRMFITGCLLFFLGLYTSSASPLNSLAARSPADRGTRAAPSTSLGVSCSKGLCRGCDLRLDLQKTKSNSLPLLLICGRSVPPPPRLSVSTVHRNSGPHLKSRPLIKQQRIAHQNMRDLSSHDTLVSPVGRSHSEKKRKGSLDVEGDRAGVPAGSEDLEQRQFTKRFLLFRTRDPTGKLQSTKLWPRQIWRNFKLGKKRMMSQLSTVVKRQDRRDVPSKLSSSAVDAAAPGASPHRWSVYFLGKRPHE